MWVTDRQLEQMIHASASRRSSLTVKRQERGISTETSVYLQSNRLLLMEVLFSLPEPETEELVV
jgi:hypothetical protein